MASIDEASGAFGGNAEQARELASGIFASKDVLDSLIGQISALGFENKAELAQASSDRAEELTSQANHLADALENIRAQIEALRDLLTTAKTSPGAPIPSTQGTDPTQRGERTRPSHPPDPNRKPDGHETEVDRGASAKKQFGIRSENEAAIVLARAGYEIKQNPPPKTNRKEPDYFMEGDYWDCYTVVTGNPEQVRTAIGRKSNPKDGRIQACRVIVNFDVSGAGLRAPPMPEAVEALLQRKPIKNLKEVKVIKDGRIFNLDLEG